MSQKNEDNPAFKLFAALEKAPPESDQKLEEIKRKILVLARNGYDSNTLFLMLNLLGFRLWEAVLDEQLKKRLGPYRIWGKWINGMREMTKTAPIVQFSGVMPRDFDDGWYVLVNPSPFRMNEVWGPYRWKWTALASAWMYVRFQNRFASTEVIQISEAKENALPTARIMKERQ